MTLALNTWLAAQTQCTLPTTQDAMRKQHRFKAPRHADDGDNLFVWTIFILLLAGFALACWLGSFYVFGHPEKAFSYGLLSKLGKLDPPKRFELTAAPRGQFLDADKLFERYGTMPPQQLALENEKFLRSYLRNYEQFKELVPYVIGSFTVTGAFRLGPGNFFPDGVVALARSTENPAVLLELIFPCAEKDSASLDRMLTTGLEIKLAKTLDLTALINARTMPDGRLNLTAVPLLYGSYTSSSATGTFTLQPPETLNVRAGLPVLNQAAVDAAEQHYEAQLRRSGRNPESPSLMRVQQPQAVKPDAVPVARALPVEKTTAAPAATPQPPTQTMDGMPVARALAVTDETDGIPVARAVAADEVLPPQPSPTPTAPPTTEPAPATILQPFSAPPPESPTTPVATPAPTSAAWNVYEPGRMPRGRLVDLNTARSMAPQGGPAELSYLSGDFNVSASGPGRAVLRGRRAGGNVRIIVDFPAGSTPPAEGETVRRDASRPFQITSVEETPEGQINVHVREVTRP